MMQIYSPTLMEGELCVVTGGGSGIGRSAATQIVALGGRVALLGRRRELVEATARELDPTGERAAGWGCDIREPDQVSAAVSAVAQRCGPITALVNNAGGQFVSPAEALSPNGFAAVVRNNLLGTFNITREVATQCLIPAKRGVIVNVIANMARGFPGMVHTGAARAGVDNMTKTLAVEWVRYGIRVNAVAPGVIGTEALSRYGDDMLEHSRKGIPMKRLGTGDEVAAAIVFLCSRASSYITGETLYIDGGARLWGETWPIPEPEASDAQR